MNHPAWYPNEPRPVAAGVRLTFGLLDLLEKTTMQVNSAVFKQHKANYDYRQLLDLSDFP